MVKPILLHGHDRALTQIKYNHDGDLIFSAGKDQRPNVWYSLNGERLGTFIGHKGAVWSIDVDWQTLKFMSGAADNTLRLWDCSTGVETGQLSVRSAVRSCVFSFSGNQALYATDATYGYKCEFHIIDVRNTDNSFSDTSSVLKMEVKDAKVTSSVWGTLDRTIITGHDDGTITQWDTRNGKVINSVKEHKLVINDLQKNSDGTMFISASKDCTAKLFDIEDLSVLKTYETERPVNSASISPLYDHVVLGGGQEAMDVTTTSTKVGKFDARFFHLVFEEEFARLKGHFGPINTLAFHPDGKSFSSGGEDGFIRIQNFDSSYFNYVFDF